MNELELKNFMEKTSVENWDPTQEFSIPISRSSWLNIILWLRQLTKTWPTPQLVPQANGSIHCVWIENNKSLIIEEYEDSWSWILWKNGQIKKSNSDQSPVEIQAVLEKFLL